MRRRDAVLLSFMGAATFILPNYPLPGAPFDYLMAVSIGAVLSWFSVYYGAMRE